MGANKNRFSITQILALIFFFASISIPSNLVGANRIPVEDFSEATSLFYSGKYNECLKYVDEAIDDGILGERWRVLKLETQLKLGKNKEALKSLGSYLSQFDNSVRLRWVGVTVARRNNNTKLARKLLAEIEDNASRTWRYKDALNQATLAEFDLARGVDPKTVIDNRLTPYANQDAAIHNVFASIGIEKGDYALASKEYFKALKLSPKNPDIHFGLARAFGNSDSQKATEYLNAALKINPNHIPSQLHLVEQKISEENYDDAIKVVQSILKTNPTQADALALRASIAHLQNLPEEEKKFRDLALSTWKGNPRVDHLIGKKLSQKYRFAEGAEYQKRALVYDSKYLPAKIQLSQDLLRLGKEAEGWKLADEVYQSDGYNILAHNLVTLRSNIREFKTLASDGFVVRMSAREAAIYGEEVLALLRKAKEQLCKKYEFKISEPIVVEIFPKQQDFAIRTFGLPGGAGFLGVCFGRVITMNSPGSQGQTPTNWKSVLWHEFCHVVTLQKTKNKMPRWLSEGISVYEERLANPAWGQSMNAEFKKMILGPDLTPVSKLSAAFLQPKSATHLQFAYYESSMVVQFLIEKHGQEIINRILVDLGLGMTINQALDRYTGSIQLLDKEFSDYIKKLAKDYAPNVKFDRPELKGPLNLDTVKELLAQNPNNYFLLQQQAKFLLQAEQFPAAQKVAEQMVKLHPSGTLPYALLARIALKTNNTKLEKEALQKLVARDSDSYASQLRLAQIAFESQAWDDTLSHARESIAINPLLPEAHRLAAYAGEKTNRPEVVVSAMRALLQLNPIDPAQAHFQYATALHAVGEKKLARRQVLKALEHAPRFREAHQLLLKLGPSTQPPVKNKNDSQKRRNR